MSDHLTSGFVLSAELCSTLEGVLVRGLGTNGTVLQQSHTNANGKWQLDSSDEVFEHVEFSKEGFATKKVPISDLTNKIRLLEDRLIGYSNRMRCTQGESVEVFAHCSEPYKAQLVRFGQERKAIGIATEHPPKTQSVPDEFFVDKGLSWEVCFSIQVPADASPGLFGIELSTDSERYVIPLVVSMKETPRSPAYRLLVLASTNTWTSYNIWGGRSRYRNYEEISPSVTNVLTRTVKDPPIKHLIKSLIKKVSPDLFNAIIRILRKPKVLPQWCYSPLSLDRPYTNCNIQSASPTAPFNSHLAEAEWRVLAWLEREGITYDYAADRTLDDPNFELAKYDAVVLSTHCEYWSKSMFDKLRDAHYRHGLWVLNLSGNAIYREVAFKSSRSQQMKSANYQMVNDEISPLLGIFYPSSQLDFRTCAPYRAFTPDHWVFSECNWPDSNKTFGHKTLNTNADMPSPFFHMGSVRPELPLLGEGASGWEMDKSAKENGFHHIAKGMNKKGGADMVVRDAEGSRGGVFSASSITFGGSLLVDSICSRAVKNVLTKALRSEKNAHG